MTRRIATLIAVVGLFTLIAVPGCSDTGWGGGGKVACQGCDAKMAEGSYCKSCERVVLKEKGTVHCDKCNADMPIGKYCKGCNAFMMKGEAKCPDCGAKMKAGTLCTKCNKYAGTKVKYCPGCKTPCGPECCGACKAKA